MVKKAIITILILLYLPLVCFAEEGKPITIRWGAMDANYHIEIRKDTYVFYENYQTENELALNLVPGEYEYQIHALDPFGKLLTSSGWIPLNVTRAQIPEFRLTGPVFVRAFSRIDFDILIEPSDLNTGTEFYLLNKEKRMQGEWDQDTAERVFFHGVKLKAGNWKLEAVDPSQQSFFQPQAVVAKTLYMPEDSLRESQFDIQFGYAPFLGISLNGETSISFSPWVADMAFLIQSGSSVPVLRSLGVEFHGYLGFDGADPTSDSSSLLGGIDVSGFFRPYTAGALAPYIQAGAGALWSDNNSFFEGRTALTFRGSLGVDISKNRHYFRIGLDGAYSFTDTKELLMCSLLLRWGYLL